MSIKQIMYLSIFWGPLPLYSALPSVEQRPQLPPFLSMQGTWAQAQLQNMSLAEKIGQLFMIDIPLRASPKVLADYKDLIQKYHIGGVWLHGISTIGKQRVLVNGLQKASSRPLLVGQDQEWGLSKRLKDGFRFPKALTLGALPTNKDHLLYLMSHELALEARRTGVHITASPVADLNTNPANPVIGFRSYGDNQERVIKKLLLIVSGLQEQRILACLKHFPGHGDVAFDSHRELPQLPHTIERLNTVELPPFIAGINNGASAVMTAHLQIPALDDTPHISATLSPLILQELLRKKLKFQGLIISDALTMHAITNHFTHDMAALLAYQAGNDLLIYPRDLEASIARITDYIGDDPARLADLNTRVHRILLAKEWLGLHIDTFVNEHDIVESPQAITLKQQLYQAAITAVNIPEHTQLINPEKPILVLHTEKHFKEFEVVLKAHYGENINSMLLELDDAGCITAELQDYGTVVIAMHTSPRGFFDKRALELIKEAQKLQSTIHVVLALFGSPYTLQHFNAQLPVIVAYEDDPDAQIAAAHACINPEHATGIVPVAVKLKES